MDLASALRNVTTPLHVPGTSDDGLVQLVNSLAAPGYRRVSTAHDLHGGCSIRAIDVLLSLARATQPHYRSDVHDVHAWWALLRYLGVFEALDGAPSCLGLSDAGRRIIGNQRRVLSEELGIGFGTLLAEKWMAANNPFSTRTIQVVDVDVLLGSPLWASLVASLVGERRPDYLLVAQDPHSRRQRLAVVECKGTRTRGYAPKQLASAAEQLAGLVVDGRAWPGLAVSSVVADHVVEYLAVQLLPAARSAAPTEYGVRVMDLTAEYPTVDVPPFSSAAEAETRERQVDGSAVALTGTALATAWATLADLAGNEQGVDRWSPARLRDPTARTPRPRQERRGPGGAIVRGVSNLLTLPGGQLEVVLGVLDHVDDALTSGDSDSIIEAQAAANAERLDRLPDEGREDAVAAYGSDGSALLLLPR